MPQERYRASVSFEYDLRPVQTTIRTELVAGGPQIAARVAVKQAKQELRPINWRSMVVVLERLDAKEADNAA